MVIFWVVVAAGSAFIFAHLWECGQLAGLVARERQPWLIGAGSCAILACVFELFSTSAPVVLLAPTLAVMNRCSEIDARSVDVISSNPQSPELARLEVLSERCRSILSRLSSAEEHLVR